MRFNLEVNNIEVGEEVILIYVTGELCFDLLHYIVSHFPSFPLISPLFMHAFLSFAYMMILSICKDSFVCMQERSGITRGAELLRASLSRCLFMQRVWMI